MFLKAQNVGFALGSRTVLDGVSFTLGPGEKVGLIGPNGCGKTTLLRLIVQELEPDDGEFVMSSAVEVGYLPQDVVSEQPGTVFDMLLGRVTELEKRIAELERSLSRHPDDEGTRVKIEALQEERDSRFGAAYRERVDESLSSMGMGQEICRKQIKELSPSERTCIGLVRVFARQPEFLLLDEPTRYLDIVQRERLAGFLAGFDGSLIVASQDRFLLNRVVNRIFELSCGRLCIYDGDYDDYLLQRDNKEAEARYTALAEVQRTLWGCAANGRSRRRTCQASSARARGIVVEGLTKSFGRKRVIDGAGFEVAAGERLALVGPTGSGKSVLLKLLAGDMKPDKGRVALDVKKVGYLPQEGRIAGSTATAIEEVMKSGAREEVCRDLLSALSVPQQYFTAKLGRLSPEERLKVALARVICGRPDILILDEPARGLDADALEALEECLQAFPGTVVFATHDQVLVERAATRVLELRDGQLVERRLAVSCSRNGGIGIRAGGRR